MKKVFISIAVLIGSLLLAFFFLVILPFMGTKEIKPGTEFAGGKIISVFDGMSQVLILDGGSREIGLMDAGNSPDGKPVIDALTGRGYKPSDVKAIFFTHGHPDHTAAAKVFPNAKLYALEKEIPIVEGRATNNSPSSLIFSAVPTGLKVTNILKDGEPFRLGSLKIEVFSVPGHTEGGAAFLVSGVLFMGDAALSSSDNKIKHAVWFFSGDVAGQDRSLKALALRLDPVKNEIRHIVFSHSGSLDGLQPLLDYAKGVK